MLFVIKLLHYAKLLKRLMATTSYVISLCDTFGVEKFDFRKVFLRLLRNSYIKRCQ